MATHIDDFIDNPCFLRGKKLSAEEMLAENYARYFFLLHRLPAGMKSEFAPFIRKYKLFCTYGGKRYRCTGASRFGDVWLRKDFNADEGYDDGMRVSLDECSGWADKP